MRHHTAVLCHMEGAYEAETLTRRLVMQPTARLRHFSDRSSTTDSDRIILSQCGNCQPRNVAMGHFRHFRRLRRVSASPPEASAKADMVELWRRAIAPPLCRSAQISTWSDMARASRCQSRKQIGGWPPRMTPTLPQALPRPKQSGPRLGALRPIGSYPGLSLSREPLLSQAPVLSEC